MPNLHQQCLRNQGYETLDLIGEGSFSSVYKVKDLNTHNLKAVKIIENQFITLSADVNRRSDKNLNNIKQYGKSIEEIRIKKLREHKIGQKYFNREIITSKRLIQSYHPFIVKIFSIKKTLLYTYIYMEHLSNGNLNDYLNKNGPLENDDLAKLWIYQLASALEYLHLIGIAHRDIKLQNIGLTDKLDAKLIDFGFACKCIINKNNKINILNQQDDNLVYRNNSSFLNSYKSIDSNLININNQFKNHLQKPSYLNRNDNYLTSFHEQQQQQQLVQFSMSQCGTPLYIPPEIIIANTVPYDPRKADIWCLGVTMFAIISFRYPFTKRDYKILYKQQLKKSWMSKRVYTCFSEDAFELIQCMLEPIPKKRYTATQIIKHKWTKSYSNKNKLFLNNSLINLDESSLNKNLKVLDKKIDNLEDDKKLNLIKINKLKN